VCGGSVTGFSHVPEFQPPGPKPFQLPAKALSEKINFIAGTVEQWNSGSGGTSNSCRRRAEGNWGSTIILKRRVSLTPPVDRF